MSASKRDELVDQIRELRALQERLEAELAKTQAEIAELEASTSTKH